MNFELKDIKDIVTLEIDFIPYLIVLFFVVVIIVFFILFQKFKNKKLTKKEKIKKYLKKYDYNKDAKTIAYEFSILVREVIDEKDLDEYEKIVAELEKYKYKKNVPLKISDELLGEIKEFIRVRI